MDLFCSSRSHCGTSARELAAARTEGSLHLVGQFERVGDITWLFHGCTLPPADLISDEVMINLLSQTKEICSMSFNVPSNVSSIEKEAHSASSDSIPLQTFLGLLLLLLNLTSDYLTNPFFKLLQWPEESTSSDFAPTSPIPVFDIS
ncbi:hypothetical protein EmuJ_000553000 [Echinococcus multilocularis]|uniref:Uncharacterized protein n=1 Tax=Echinococcus multilocularis TaxID=6211 RepID=A0A068Y129_ECHMU|nr:hypothetical protein EmuJ_000553000 [Echinococcus multilocularis]